MKIGTLQEGCYKGFELNIFDRLWKKNIPEILHEESVFVTIPCQCGEKIDLTQSVLPGEAAVIECDNCSLSWTIYSPSLIVKKTKELPADLQEVWRKLELA